MRMYRSDIQTDSYNSNKVGIGCMVNPLIPAHALVIQRVFGVSLSLVFQTLVILGTTGHTHVIFVRS